MKIGLSILAIVLAALVVLFRYSSATDTYVCSGTISSETEPDKEVTVFMAHEKYAPWVHLWSDSDGSVWIEGKEVWTTFYSNTHSNKRTLLVYADESVEDLKLVGQYSFLQDYLTIDLGWQRFRGNCIAKSDALQS